ncbi:MAG: phosphate ABC transporter permease subunit PstC [Candidatus Methanoperedens sp.]|jgi:phosphate transport system permease protein|nr:phosphate ABC transporter permease subunit PstC [Candidatus Methanoperedens sp.]PKL54627.1 MAG: phosphate ABC transporter permease subunit PstC [Candidatus Methanoperedenaceae archaeon HGW-Methanoperedenaceae-1]
MEIRPDALKWQNIREMAIEKAFFLCAIVSILTTLGIVLVLVFETFSFFKEVPVLEFLTGTTWAPTYRPQHFGVLPLINGTLMIAGGAAVIAIPLGIASAIYLSEYASAKVRNTVKPALEILAGIPTVVYGYFAISFITPLLRNFVDTNIFNAASASIVVGIMILPMISSLSEDAMRSVPRALREGAYALGSTKFDVSTKIVVPSALSGIIASFILAISRAIGETMAVTLAAGATPKMTLNFFESIQTMTAYIVQVSMGDTPFGSIEYKTIFAVGMVLFVMTLFMNIVSMWIKGRYREVYN